MRVTVSVGVAGSPRLSMTLSRDELGSMAELGLLSDGGAAADLASHLSVHWLADLSDHGAALLRLRQFTTRQQQSEEKLLILHGKNHLGYVAPGSADGVSGPGAGAVLGVVEGEGEAAPLLAHRHAAVGLRARTRHHRRQQGRHLQLHPAALYCTLRCLLLYSRARVRRSTAAVSPLQRLHSLYFLHSTFFQVTAVTVIVS